MSNLNSKELIERFRADQSSAATEIFERYLTRLLALIQSKLGRQLNRRVDAEDIAQSAYRSFFIAAKNQAYPINKSGDLWRLLVGFALNKLYGQIETHTAAKRNLRREEPTDSFLVEAVSRNPSMVEAIAVAESFQIVLNNLTATEQLLLSAMLQNQTLEEIATQIGKSPRTVRRLFAEIRGKVEHRLLSGERRTSPPTPLIEPYAPLKFSDYVLEKLIGAGGMGKVFRAAEKSTGKKLAIKSLHKAKLTDPRATELFLREAELLSRLSHPNIVGIHGLGKFPSGAYFMLMELVEGFDLQTRLREGPLPVQEALRIVIEVTGAIGYAHAQGIIHCDLKPANVLIDTNGRAQVTDFGFAFLVTQAYGANRTQIGGTASYIAPEILLGQSEPTPGADIFAIGKLFWMLVSEPFGPDLFPLAPPENVPPDIGTICRRCAQNDPKDRFQSAAELTQALRQLEPTL